MTIRFGGNTFSYMWTATAEQAIAELAELGVNDFDVLVTPDHLWPWELDGSARQQMRKRLGSRGIRIESLNPPALDYNLGSLVNEVRAVAVNLYEETLRLAADLGAKGIVVVPGRVSSLLPPPESETSKRLVDTIGGLAKTAESLGLRIHLETHPLTSRPTAQALLGLIKDIPFQSLGVAYDLSNAEFIGEDQVTAIRALGPYLTQMHVSDGTRQSWLHAAVGEGTVDFAGALAAAHDIGFAGVAIIELISPNPVSAYKKSIAALARFDAV